MAIELRMNHATNKVRVIRNGRTLGRVDETEIQGRFLAGYNYDKQGQRVRVF